MSERFTKRAPAAVCAVAALAVSLLAMPTPRQAYADQGTDQSAHQETERDKLLLVMDSSGSMGKSAGGGQTKIQAAKQALGTVVAALPSDARVGMRVYGATVYSARDKGACTDTQLVVPVGPADKPALRSAIGRYRPYGETPIAYSLQQAAHDLGSSGHRTILLVSDGEETCNADPCEVARQLTAQGIDLKIDVVGFRVSGGARNQLRCIADAGHGSYYDAGSAQDLVGSLGKLATRAYRPFGVSGTPVAASTTPATAPEVHPGQYVTKVDASGRSPRYLAVTKTPGSTLWLSVTVRPPYASGQQAPRRYQIALTAGDPSDTCKADNSEWTNNGNDTQNVIVGNVLLDPRASESTAGCAKLDRIFVGVLGGGGPAGQTWDAEVLIVEEPPVASTSGLPGPDAAGADLPTTSDWTGAPKATPVVGGTQFSDAPTLGPGVYSDTIVPGERLIYRVRGDFGQRVRADIHVPRATPALVRALPTIEGQHATVLYGRMYGPGRVDMTVQHAIPNALVSGTNDAKSSMAVISPQVRYQNRASDDQRVEGASLAGSYYIEVNTPRHGDQTYAIPFQLKVSVEGAVAGRPSYGTLRSYDSATPGATPTRNPRSSPTTPSASATLPSTDRGASSADLTPIVATGGSVLAAILVLGAVVLGIRTLRRR